MSKYEDYGKASKFYDNSRKAIASDVVIGLLHVYGGKPLQDLRVLDAGCGTGNYSRALLDAGITKLSLLDGSAGMLSVCKSKLREAVDKNYIEKIVEARLPDLPFDDGHFDAVFISQVLHHLDSTNNREFPIIEATFREARRILRPNGTFIVAAAIPPQISQGIWFCQLNETLCERYANRFPTLEHYLAMLERSGFRCMTKLSVLGHDLYDDIMYSDPEGPLKEEWRNGDSVFGLATEQELENIKDFVREMNNNGKMREFMKEHDKTSELGTIIILTCTAV